MACLLLLFAVFFVFLQANSFTNEDDGTRKPLELDRTMKIIESNIVGKKSQETCEDGIVITDDFVAVIDGSTSKTPTHLAPDMKNGRYAMTLISEYIQQELAAEASVDDFCQGVTDYIYNKVYGTLGVEERLRLHPEERLTASAAIYSRTRQEVWMVGDCQAIICGKLYENGKPYEPEIAEKRAVLIRQGMSPAEARQAIVPQLVQAMLEGQNKSYAVIDGFPIEREGVKVVSCSPGILDGKANTIQKQELVLATDGYPFLKPTLGESEKALADQLAHDPQNIDTFIATKGLVEGNVSFDDRAYVRFLPHAEVIETR